MTTIHCITFGLGNTYKANFWTPISNVERETKPRGGLWTSPINSEYGWKEYCINNQWNLGTLNTSFQFYIKSERILIIDNEGDLKKMSWIICPLTSMHFLDFEKMFLQYDAIWLTEKGQTETHMSFPKGLYGWDCECLLVLNPRCIHEVEPEDLIDIQLDFVDIELEDYYSDLFKE